MLRPLMGAGGQFLGSFSPRGEGQDEGGFSEAPTRDGRNFRRLLLRENLAAGRAKPRPVLLKAGHDLSLVRYLRAAKPENVGSAG